MLAGIGVGRAGAALGASDCGSMLHALGFFLRRATPFHYIRVGLRLRHITPRIARRGIESSTRLGRYRWVVERTLAWLHRLKRLRIREERNPEIHLALLQLGCCLVLYREIERRES